MSKTEANKAPKQAKPSCYTSFSPDTRKKRQTPFVAHEKSKSRVCCSYRDSSWWGLYTSSSRQGESLLHSTAQHSSTRMQNVANLHDKFETSPETGRNRPCFGWIDGGGGGCAAVVVAAAGRGTYTTQEAANMRRVRCGHVRMTEWCSWREVRTGWPILFDQIFVGWYFFKGGGWGR